MYSRLEELRTERTMSRQELAEAVGVHYQTVGYLERGEYSPSLSLALRIARVLDVRVEEAFSLEPLTAHSPHANPAAASGATPRTEPRT